MEKQDYKSSLLLKLAPDNVVVQARITENPDIDFREFINDNLLLLSPVQFLISNELLMRIDFRNPNDIPEINDKFPLVDLTRLLQDHSACKDIKITAIPLFDAWVCSECNLDPLAPDNNHIQLKDSRDYANYYLNNRDNFIGIRTDLGLHLFSSDEKGFLALRRCLEYYSNHFFDKQKGTDHLDIVSVRILDEAPEFSGNKFSNTMDWKVSPLDLPQDFFNRNKAIIEIPENKFDMLPTVYNYYRLRNENEISSISMSDRLYDYTSLIELHDGECTLSEPLDPETNFQQFSFEDRFDDLKDELFDCDDDAERAEARQRFRERVEEIMEKEFPELHYCRDPKVIEAELLQTQQTDEPIANVVKGLKM